MRIPKQIKVGGHVYTVEQSLLARENGNRAECAHVSRMIRIDSSMPVRQDKFESFIHELLHAVNEVYLAGKLEEDAIRSLSEGLFQVLVDAGIELDGDEQKAH